MSNGSLTNCSTGKRLRKILGPTISFLREGGGVDDLVYGRILVVELIIRHVCYLFDGTGVCDGISGELPKIGAYFNTYIKYYILSI